VERANRALAMFPQAFHDAYLEGLCAKIGLEADMEGDAALAQDLLAAMAENKADFTLTFRRLCDAAAGPADDEAVRSQFIDPTVFDRWALRWRERLAQEPTDGEARRSAMQAVNPALIPRNHRVEAVIEAAVERQDFQPFEELLQALSAPYEDQPAFAAYAEAPAESRSYVTYCGT
jgi:uncharacterized protein YdiU (UPF0061 family)